MTRSLAVQGMHCQNCAAKLTKAFLGVAGVRSAHVSLTPPTALLETAPDVPLAALQSAARRAGAYEVSEVAPRESGTTQGLPPETTSPSAPASQDPIVANPPGEKKPSLYPLILIVAFIAGTTAIAQWSRGPWTAASWHWLMVDFMAGFFLVFSFFKLLDLRGFADAYQTYDVVARRVRAWALAYPFIELALGIAYLTRWNLPITNAVTLGLMLLGSVGVLRALMAKRRIRCACLGTALNLPMTTVTLVEDLGMAAMAAGALAWGI